MIKLLYRTPCVLSVIENCVHLHMEFWYQIRSGTCENFESGFVIYIIFRGEFASVIIDMSLRYEKWG